MLAWSSFLSPSSCCLEIQSIKREYLVSLARTLLIIICNNISNGRGTTLYYDRFNIHILCWWASSELSCSFHIAVIAIKYHYRASISNDSNKSPVLTIWYTITPVQSIISFRPLKLCARLTDYDYSHYWRGTLPDCC